MAGLLSPTLESQFAGSCTLTPPGVHSIIKAAETERAQVHEAHAARDVVVSLLATVTRSVQEKTSQISQLQDEKSRLQDALTALQQPADDKNKLHPTNLAQRPTGHGKPLSISTVSFGVHGAQNLLTPPITPTESNGAGSACKNAQPSSVSSRSGDESVNGSNSSFNAIQDESSLDPDDTIKARHAALASFPVPVGIPDDELKPISLPPHITMQEFLSDLPTALSVSLSNYRILQEVTTHWCPEREEHGYYLSPLFKCSTNSRFATAHNWIKADVVGSLSRPTECFYLRGGQWYYAGVYVAVRLTDLTSQEWDHLSTESAQAILKDTLAERKNVAPQHLYEVAQLYAAGALRVACVGLKCIGFNASIYHSLLEHATRTGRTSRQWSNPVPRESLGSESPMSMLSPTATPFDSPRLFSLAVHGTTANSHHGGAA
ncbi:hypothetical protein PENSPDRAFT_635332 [Peniophora sp. CONT]|nr:hypothetical protein PENSPDRAFT_635332 [Peniophora sp. CONT]